jgi:hypothetical protein
LVLLIVSGLDWCWLRWLHMALLRMIYHKYASISRYINTMHGVQRVVYYMLIHNLLILTPYKPFTNLPLAFFIFS